MQQSTMRAASSTLHPGPNHPLHPLQPGRTPFQPGSRKQWSEGCAWPVLHHPRGKKHTREKTNERTDEDGRKDLTSLGHKEQPPREVHGSTTSRQEGTEPGPGDRGKRRRKSDERKAFKESSTETASRPAYASRVNSADETESTCAGEPPE